MREKIFTSLLSKIKNFSERISVALPVKGVKNMLVEYELELRFTFPYLCEKKSKGMLREIEITEVMRTKLEAALIIQRWFRQLKESRRTSLLNKPPDQLAQASDQQAQDELKRSAGKKRESSASINSRDDPQNKKNVLITPYDTATFASPMSMSKITSPRTGADANTSELEEEPRQMPIPSSNHPNASEDGRVQETGGLLNRTSPEKEETISKRTAEKLKSKELSPEQRLEKEKEKNQSAKEKLKLLREAEMKVISR